MGAPPAAARASGIMTPEAERLRWLARLIGSAETSSARLLPRVGIRHRESGFPFNEKHHMWARFYCETVKSLGVARLIDASRRS